MGFLEGKLMQVWGPPRQGPPEFLTQVYSACNVPLVVSVMGSLECPASPSSCWWAMILSCTLWAWDSAVTSTLQWIWEKSLSFSTFSFFLIVRADDSFQVLYMLTLKPRVGKCRVLA